MITCGPQTPIRLVAETMAAEHVDAVVVTAIECIAWAVVAALDLAAAAVTDTIELVACDIARRLAAARRRYASPACDARGKLRVGVRNNPVGGRALRS